MRCAYVTCAYVMCAYAIEFDLKQCVDLPQVAVRQHAQCVLQQYHGVQKLLLREELLQLRWHILDIVDFFQNFQDKSVLHDRVSVCVECVCCVCVC